jgi:DNA primase
VSPFLKETSLEAVQAAADIVDVVSGYTTLRKRGNTYTGLCPFHQEKSPSFSVSADKGLFYCFGCGEGGTVFTFLQRMENLTFPEAVEQLAERFHVTLEYQEGQAPDSAARSRERRLLAALEKAAVFFQRYLWESTDGAVARTYLEDRGLGSEVAREYRVGLAPAEWRGLHRRALKDGFSEDELDGAGLLVRQSTRTYDRFRGRLMFPLVDHRGRVVGFGGRTLGDETPKYLNSPEGPLYQKGRLLYGLFQGRKAIAEADEVLVVEGYTDVLALAQAGVRHVVASMGTALTDGQVMLMKRLTSHVTFMFDGDRAGVDAVLRSGELVRGHGLRPLVVCLPEGEDPADVVKRSGATGVKRLVSARVSLLRFEVQRTLDRGDTSSSEGRVRAFDEVRRVLDRAGSPKEREEEIATIADRLRLSPKNITLLLDSPAAGPVRVGRGESHGRVAAPSAAPPRPHPPRPRGRGVALSETLLSAGATVEREFLVAVVANPGSARSLLDGLAPDHFEIPLHREAFAGLREVMAVGEPATVLHRHAREDSELGRFFVRLALEAEDGRHSAAVLQEMYLRLQEQHLARETASLKRSLESDDVDTQSEQRLYHLELLRQQVRTRLSNLDEG